MEIVPYSPASSTPSSSSSGQDDGVNIMALVQRRGASVGKKLTKGKKR